MGLFVRNIVLLSCVATLVRFTEASWELDNVMYGSVEGEQTAKLPKNEDAWQFCATLQQSLPTSCSYYQNDPAYEGKLENVPLSSDFYGNTITTMANCTILEEYRNVSNDVPVFEVPTNSLLGRTLYLKGIPRRLSPVAINFMTNEPRRFFFHFVAYPAAFVIVRNDFINSWNTEETKLDKPFPFRYNVPFEMKVTVDQMGFHVEVYGKHLLTFKHRQRPLSDITKITFTGTFDIIKTWYN